MRNIGILMVLLIYTAVVCEGAKAPEKKGCLVKQTMEAYKTYFINNEKYPLYHEGEYQCRWALKLPHRVGQIIVSCSDLDIPIEKDCPNNYLLISGFEGYSFEKICEEKEFRRVYEADELNIDLIKASKNRGRFSCTVVAKFGVQPPNIKPIKPPAPRVTECQCGQKLSAQEYKIIGGPEARTNPYPFMAALVDIRRIRPDDIVICSATIISRRYALSSAQCVPKLNAIITVGLRVGHQDLATVGENDTSGTYEIDWAKKNIDFDGTSFKTWHYSDILLIRTKKLIKFSGTVGRVCLPFNYTEPTKIINGNILGWSEIDVLRDFSTKILYLASGCSSAFFGTIYQGLLQIKGGMMCAQREITKKITCGGDLGGPLLKKYKDKYLLLGILTLEGCVFNFIPGEGEDEEYKPIKLPPDLFTKVSFYLDWILEHTQDSFLCGTKLT